MADPTVPGWKQVAQATPTLSPDTHDSPVEKPPCSGACQKDLAQIMAAQETIATMLVQVRDRVDVLKDAVNQIGELSNNHADQLNEIVTMAKTAFTQFAQTNPLSLLMGKVRRG